MFAKDARSARNMAQHSLRRNSAAPVQAAGLAGLFGMLLFVATELHAQYPAMPFRSPETVPAPPTPTPPPQARPLVVDVQVVGNSSTKDVELQRHIQVLKDREFDPELVQSDVRRLVQTGLFKDVRTYTRDVPAGVIVIYQVFERPRIGQIRHIGNRGFSDKKLIKEHGLRPGDSINAYTSEEARRKIEDLYHKEGYPHASVVLQEGNKPGDKNVVFLINEGQLERIAGVSFEGNSPDIATDGRLRTQIESKPGYAWYLFGGKVDHEKIAADVEKLTAYYRSLGFFRARVGRELIYDKAGQWLTLKFIIDEGPRYVVRNVSIEGNLKFASMPLLEFLSLKSGQYFNQAEMNKDITAIVDLYGSQGHVFADVQADPRFLEEPGQMDVIYRVKEGDVFSVGQIHVHIAGEFPHTRETVVLNRAGNLRPGDLVDTRDIRDWERRLKASQLFETNPANGDPPRVVVRPPELSAVGLAAYGSRQRTVRGQSPDEYAEFPPLPTVTSPPERSTGRTWTRWFAPSTSNTQATNSLPPAQPQTRPYGS
jgi:outer membrane protein insertion porin family